MEDAMTYLDTIRNNSTDPERLELAYQAAVRAGDAADFVDAMEASYADAPGNSLLAAWHYRFVYALTAEGAGRAVAWGWAVLAALLNGAALWLLSADRFMLEPFGNPGILLTWAPASASAVLIFLALAGSLGWIRVAIVGAALFGTTLYAYRAIPWLQGNTFQEQYIALMTLHLPLLAWAGVGAALLWPRREADNRFAFLLKSLEVFIVGGLFGIAVGLFTFITVGLFDALGIQLGDPVMRVLVMGVGGLMPVLAVAVVYDPALPPVDQPFGDGMSKLIGLLMRILLPLTLIVLLVYVAFIPFNFRAPFENRDVLIVYSAMLFAVAALLTGATPAAGQALDPQTARWLRLGMLALSGLTVLVGLYALAAIGYRTWEGGWTPNRLTFVGWNVINLAILSGALVALARTDDGSWPATLRVSLSRGMVAYAIWVLVTIVAVPLIF
jgi:hypothetical protein